MMIDANSSRLLEELDDDIMLEFDEHIRYCQTICSPYTRSVQQATIAAKYKEEMEQKTAVELQRKIRFHNDAIKAAQQAAIDARPPPAAKSQTTPLAPLPAKIQNGVPVRPVKLVERQKSNELMFDMDDDDGRYKKPVVTKEHLREKEGGRWQKVGQAVTKLVVGLPSPAHSFPPRPSSVLNAVTSVPHTPPNVSVKSPSTPSRTPWTAATASPAKVDLKTVMAEASSASSRQSNITIALANASGKTSSQGPPRTPNRAPAKADRVPLVSAAVPAVQQPSFFFAPIPSAPVRGKQARPSTPSKTTPSSSSAPWQAPSPAPIVSIKELLTSPVEAAQMSVKIKPPTFSDQAKGTGYAGAEASLNLSLSDIISQQQTEQDIIQGKVLKRSLEEIQQEQEFQAWWDAECERVQLEQEEEEGKKVRKSSKKEDKKESGGSNGRKGRGGGGKKKEKEVKAADNAASPDPVVPDAPIGDQSSSQTKPNNRRRNGKSAMPPSTPEATVIPSVTSELSVHAPTFTPGVLIQPAISTTAPTPSRTQHSRKGKESNKNQHPNGGARPGLGSRQTSTSNEPSQSEAPNKGKDNTARRLFNRPRKPKDTTGSAGGSKVSSPSLNQRPPLHASTTTS